MTPETKSVLVLLSVWLCAALILGLTGAFESASAPKVAVTVWTLTALILLAWWNIPRLTRWVTSVDLSWLVALHLTRFVGCYFLLLCRNGSLSCTFAKPAGIGDIIIAFGATILLVSGAVRRQWRKLMTVWNVLGLLDIVMVAFAALRVGLHDWPGMAPLRTWPLMLLPTFLVPLIIASHILIFVRLWKSRAELVSSH